MQRYGDGRLSFLIVSPGLADPGFDRNAPMDAGREAYSRPPSLWLGAAARFMQPAAVTKSIFLRREYEHPVATRKGKKQGAAGDYAMG